MVYDSSRTIDLDNVPLDGGVLLRVTYLSNDPYLRIKMSAPQKGKWAVSCVPLTLCDPYLTFVCDQVPQFTLGQPYVELFLCCYYYADLDRLDNFGIGRVVRSEDSNFKPGDHVSGFLSMFILEHMSKARPQLSSHRIRRIRGRPWRRAAKARQPGGHPLVSLLGRRRDARTDGVLWVQGVRQGQEGADHLDYHRCRCCRIVSVSFIANVLRVLYQLLSQSPYPACET